MMPRHDTVNPFRIIFTPYFFYFKLNERGKTQTLNFVYLAGKITTETEHRFGEVNK